MDPDDTAELVIAAAAGDAVAWKAIVDRFSGLVWSVARGFRLSTADAEDVCQTTWLRLAESIHRIQHPERVGGWLAVTARREALRVIELSARSMAVGDHSALSSHLRDDDTPEDAVIQRAQAGIDSARARALWRALDGLPEQCRRLLRILMASPPPRYADVAAVLDMPVGSIGPTRKRCLVRLQRAAAAGGISDDAEPS